MCSQDNKRKPRAESLVTASIPRKHNAERTSAHSKGTKPILRYNLTTAKSHAAAGCQMTRHKGKFRANLTHLAAHLLHWNERLPPPSAPPVQMAPCVSSIFLRGVPMACDADGGKVSLCAFVQWDVGGWSTLLLQDKVTGERQRASCAICWYTGCRTSCSLSREKCWWLITVDLHVGNEFGSKSTLKLNNDSS